jgi:5-methylcytosine-specific restriction endonuclease McrA
MNNPVLVLNLNYEPLQVCDTRRALNLILDGKAKMVANGRGLIRSVRKAFPCPSIIQLRRVIHHPRSRLHISKREILRRDNYICQYCGRRTFPLTVDHIIPRHRGGTHSWQNLTTACVPCNRKKGGRSLCETSMRLQRKPEEPPQSALYLFGHYLDGNSEWRTYLEGW